ncbi:MAG: AAA family ATPase [Candidatus Hydrogenedentales bacterium]|jgi:putative ATP-dependent endonuclease of OLD family
MFLAELRIENFRMFGEGEQALVVPFQPGLTALVGENDGGKTSVIDAIRLALGTRDQEFMRIEDNDFHQPSDGSALRTEIRIRCKFEDLARQDIAAFVEYLTYEDKDTVKLPVLYLTWKATVAAKARGQRRFTSVEVKSGQAGDGPQFDSEARILLGTTYLRPLRDAERALSAGRGSRLSQILQHTKEVTDHGKDYDPQAPPTDLSALSVQGIGDLADALLSKHQGVQLAQSRLNNDYLEKLSFSQDQLQGAISVGGSKGDKVIRLRQLLEKLDLELRDGGIREPPPGRGLGSNNLLFMACELLLLGSEDDGVPMLLIEEPEAHLHPQRQLRLMQFLQQKASEPRADGQNMQTIVTTHSPNLASAIDLENIVLLHQGRAFPMESGCTRLAQSDYGFLNRFLDVTKANIFFARGLLIVEGDAENILLPTLARLIGRDLTENGVSIINVGGTGLRRFARIYQRRYPDKDGIINVPIACLADADVMANCAPEIIGMVKVGEEWPPKNKRRWRAKADFTAEELERHRQNIHAKASGQRVETFVADEWTLEYDLSYCGLAREVWIAAHLAKADDAINAGKTSRMAVACNALRSFADLAAEPQSREEVSSRIYAEFAANSAVSKPTAAQYLACVLEARLRKGRLTPATLREALPPYIVCAIDYVTRPKDSVDKAGAAKEDGATRE